MSFITKKACFSHAFCIVFIISLSVENHISYIRDGDFDTRI